MTISPIGGAYASSHATALQFIRGLYANRGAAPRAKEPDAVAKDNPIKITNLSAAELGDSAILAPYYLRRISENGTRYLMRVWYA